MSSNGDIYIFIYIITIYRSGHFGNLLFQNNLHFPLGIFFSSFIFIKNMHFTDAFNSYSTLILIITTNILRYTYSFPHQYFLAVFFFFFIILIINIHRAFIALRKFPQKFSTKSLNFSHLISIKSS